MTDTTMIDARGSNPKSGIALSVDGLTYGDKAADTLAAMRQMVVPKELVTFVTALHAQSKLLALSGGAVEQSIYDAYGADLTLMNRYRSAFKSVIEAAVRARADERHIDAQAVLAELVGSLGDIGNEPKLELGAEAATLKPDELLARLQQEFRDEVENLKIGIVLWLHELTEREIVSVIQWHSPRAVTYHFFRVESSSAIVGNKTVDPGMSLTGRHVTTTTTRRSDITEERRDHTVLNAKRHPLDTYPNRVPERIARLINAIPAEVRPFVEIIDGTVSKEQVTRKVDSKTTTETRSVWKDDPTPALFGTWAIAGWGGSTPEEARALYSGHVQTKANNWLVASIIALLVVAGAVYPFGGMRAVASIMVLGLLLTLFSQLGMRLGSSSRPSTQS